MKHQKEIRKQQIKTKSLFMAFNFFLMLFSYLSYAEELNFENLENHQKNLTNLESKTELNEEKTIVLENCPENYIQGAITDNKYICLSPSFIEETNTYITTEGFCREGFKKVADYEESYLSLGVLSLFLERSAIFAKEKKKLKLKK